MSFFQDRGGERVAYEAPNRVYARVDATAKESDDGRTRLECVDADWLDGIARELAHLEPSGGGILTHPEVAGERHEAAGWARVRCLGTGESHPAQPANHCHVHIYWDAAAPDVDPPCSRLGLPVQCDLGPCRR